MAKITASLIIIGNEILSGRTQDANINFLAKTLHPKGINLLEVAVIPDNHAKIISKVQEFSKDYDLVFTSGGIGPTHDDITTESMAEAFNTHLELNEDAQSVMQQYYTQMNDVLTEARLKMAYIPHGARLIKNSVSAAPGFILNNVYVLAGVPKIFQAMLSEIIPSLPTGDLTYEKTVKMMVGESRIAADLADLQKEYPQIEIGSYPFGIDGDKHGTNLVLRATDQELLEQVFEKLATMVKSVEDKYII